MIDISFVYLLVAIWTSFALAEQMCILFLLFVKSRISTAIAVSYVLCLSLVLASGTVRSYKGLQPWLQENTKATHTRYASKLLHSIIIYSNCTNTNACTSTGEYLQERLGVSTTQVFIVVFLF